MYCVYNTNIVYILIIYVVDVNIYSTYYLDIEKNKMGAGKSMSVYINVYMKYNSYETILKLSNGHLQIYLTCYLAKGR